MNQAQTATASPPARVAVGHAAEMHADALPASAQARAALLGTLFGLAALAAATALALAITAGPFHTSLGSLT